MGFILNVSTTYQSEIYFYFYQITEKNVFCNPNPNQMLLFIQKENNRLSHILV